MVDTRSGDAAAAPEVTAVRRRFLMTVMIGAVVWGGAMSVPAQLGWVPLGQPQADNNLAFFAVTCVLLLVVWRRPTSFMPVAVAYLVVAFAYISAAQFNVHADSLRMLLFFPAVGAIFLILGGLAAWIAIAAALGVFAAAVMTGDMPATPLSASTFALTLFFTGLFFHAFSAQAIEALRTISAQNAALDAAARQDHLTHLLNLRAFRETMQDHVAHAVGSAGLCVAFVDVDHFKAINDRHGHAGGDAVLVALSRTLTAAVRPQDVVARIGGEEFAILLPRTGVAEALPIVEGVRAAVEAMRVQVGAETLAVTVSLGLEAWRAPASTVDEMLQAADAAMYLAKDAGRNRVAVGKRPYPASGSGAAEPS